ncbi:DUF6191 domain-containing protein [Streptomyces sp. NPDC048338]|uniref:DUF6191 domain-containing protein n=1 Tax=Streptomyces sp. NPDC048338 TaxID=3365536 RepID=UPI00371F728C
MAEEFFAPSRKHTDDERRRLALTREDLGDGDPSRGPIDLTSGQVTIRVPAPGDAPAEDAPADPAPDDGGGPGERAPGEVPRTE